MPLFMLGFWVYFKDNFYFFNSNVYQKGSQTCGQVLKSNIDWFLIYALRIKLTPLESKYA